MFISAKFNKNYLFGINKSLVLPKQFFYKFEQVKVDKIIYYNYYVTEQFITAYLKKEIHLQKPATVLIEHTSANLDYKNLHIGNYINGLVGRFLANLYNFRGDSVVQENYVNDSNNLVKTLYCLSKITNYSFDELYAHRKEYTTPIKIPETELAQFRRWQEDYTQYQLSKLTDILKTWGIKHDICVYQSRIQDEFLLAPPHNEQLATYYLVGNKKVYVTDSNGNKLYAYADIGLLLKRFLDSHYDKVICLLGGEQKLYSENILQISSKILNIPIVKIKKKVFYLITKLLRIDDQKISKRGGKTFRLIDLDPIYGEYLRYKLLHTYYQTSFKLEQFYELAVLKELVYRRDYHCKQELATPFSTYLNVIDYAQNLVSIDKLFVDYKSVLQTLRNLSQYVIVTRTPPIRVIQFCSFLYASLL